MHILSREDYFKKIESLTKNGTDDDITTLEDLTDTYNDLEKKANGDGENWKEKYDELDKTWRERYRHRFFSSDGGNPCGNSGDKDDEESPEDLRIEDLFKE